MKNFTRMMLWAYPTFPRLLEVMQWAVEESAVASFYDNGDCIDQTERLLEQIERQKAVTELTQMIDRAVLGLKREEREILSERFFGAQSDGKARYPKSTYYRKLHRAIERFEDALYRQGAEDLFEEAKLSETTYFSFLRERMKEARRPKPAFPVTALALTDVKPCKAHCEKPAWCRREAEQRKRSCESAK